MTAEEQEEVESMFDKIEAETKEDAEKQSRVLAMTEFSVLQRELLSRAHFELPKRRVPEAARYAAVIKRHIEQIWEVYAMRFHEYPNSDPELRFDQEKLPYWEHEYEKEKPPPAKKTKKRKVKTSAATKAEIAALMKADLFAPKPPAVLKPGDRVCYSMSPKCNCSEPHPYRQAEAPTACVAP